MTQDPLLQDGFGSSAKAPLDVLIVGGGPSGTATAFRAKELGLKALVIELDELLKRIRDYAKDKPILPSHQGGANQKFPAGGRSSRCFRSSRSTRTRCALAGRDSIGITKCRTRWASR